MVRIGGQFLRYKKGWTRGCICSRECLFYTGSFVKLAASAGSGEEGKCDEINFLLSKNETERQF